MTFVFHCYLFYEYIYNNNNNNIIIKFFTVNTVKVTILDVIIQIGMKIELRY